MKRIRINPADNVEVDLNSGHKHALEDLRCGDNVIKYGFPIGHLTRDVKKGELLPPPPPGW